jgi:hypothetical protein
MKRINLTENDIFNIVNKVIAEESKLTKTPEELINLHSYTPEFSSSNMS